MNLELAASLCKQFEGFRSKPYLCPANVATIGYGSTYYANGVKVTLNDPLIDAFIEALEQKLDVSKILLETTFISQSTTLSKQLNQFQKQDNNLGLVVDEYGEIQGLLTIEDIFNEIVGKFGAAKKELEKEFIQKKDGSVIADGNSKIRDLNNYVGWDLDEDGSKTINGAIIDHLDQIPQENVCLELGLYRIEVLQIEENFITKVKINKKGS